jgi:hypothetical protein
MERLRYKHNEDQEADFHTYKTPERSNYCLFDGLSRVKVNAQKQKLYFGKRVLWHSLCIFLDDSSSKHIPDEIRGTVRLSETDSLFLEGFVTQYLPDFP